MNRAFRVVWLFGPVVLLVVLAAPEWLHYGSHSLERAINAVTLGPNRVFQIVYGLLIIAMALALGGVLKQRDIGSRGPALLWLLAATVIVSGACAMEPSPGDDWTTRRLVFGGCGVMTVVLIPSALISFYRAFRRNARWERIAFVTLVAASLAVVATALMILFLPSRVEHTQISTLVLRRAHLTVFVGWYLVVAYWFMRATPAATGVQPAATEPTEKPIEWERLAAKIEVVSVPLVLIGGVIALLEYCDNHQRDRRELAARAYEKADANWTEFLKLCLQYPETDCYSGSPLAGATEPTDPIAKARMRLVLTFAIDAFEVAYVNYNDATYAEDSAHNYCTQWPTWMVAIRKFSHRPDFQHTWQEVGDEYDEDFQKCVRNTIKEQQGTEAGKWTLMPLPDGCEMFDCSKESAAF